MPQPLLVTSLEHSIWAGLNAELEAPRIEKYCKPGSILISQSMRDAIITAQHPEIRYDDVFHIAVKGKREALPVCHVKTDTLANN